MEKNQIVELDIADLSDEGLGIGHVCPGKDKAGQDRVRKEDAGTGQGQAGGEDKGMAVFVKDSLVGDRIEARIVKVKKTYAFGRLERILSPSPDRCMPPCPVARSCGGCQIQEMVYPAQLRLKERKVRNNLERIGKVSKDATYYPIHGMDDPFFFRNKAAYPIGRDKRGKLIAGFYAGRTHSVVDGSDCVIGIEENRPILDTILAWMEKYQVPEYREETGEGLIRTVMIRCGFATGQIMVVVVAKGDRLPHEEKLIAMLGEALSGQGSAEALTGTSHPAVPEIQTGQAGRTEKVHEAGQAGRTEEVHQTGQAGRAEKVHEAGQAGRTEEVHQIDEASQTAARESAEEGIRAGASRPRYLASIILNTNKKNTNVILGPQNRTLWGRDWIEDKIGEVLYQISPLSFYQVNPIQTCFLYETALSYAGLTGQEVVWDLYCGIGTISLFLAQKAKMVYGVEIVPDAIANAKKNAELNHIENVRFECGKAEEVLPREYRDHQVHADVIVVDPPRKGLEPKVIGTIISMTPDRVVYVSCNSATLARDLTLFEESGYRTEKVQPVDMFPHSVHVETVCLMSRVKEK